MQALEMAFQAHTTVYLEGPQGVGKTVVAGEFLRRWTSAGRGPAFWFDFQHPASVSQIYDRVGPALQAGTGSDQGPQWPGMEAAQRKAAAVALLRQHPVLVVLHHVEILTDLARGGPTGWTAQDADNLTNFLDALNQSAAHVLITRRPHPDWPGVGHDRLVLHGLPLKDARVMADAVLSGAGLSQSQRDSLGSYGVLLAYLHGNPQAMQIVLPELRRKTLGELLDALRAGWGEPAETYVCGAAVAYRLSTLDPALRRRLGVLGLFRGFVAARVLAAISFLPDAPEVLRDLGRDDWTRVFDAVANIGLLQRLGEGQYGIPSFVQKAYEDLLREAFPEKVEWLEQKFCAVCGRAGNQLFQISQANPEFANSLLRQEQHNLMRAYCLARQKRDWDDLKEILCGVRSLLQAQGRWTEWESVVAELQADLGDSPVAGAEVLWLRLVGHRTEICAVHGNFPQLQQIRAQLKQKYGIAADQNQECDVLDALGGIAEQQQQWEEAERFYRKSLELKQRLGDECPRAPTLLRLGDLAMNRRPLREAEQWYQQALGIWSSLEDSDGEATACCRLGALEQARGDFDQAKVWYLRSVKIREQAGDLEGQTQSLSQLAKIAESLGNEAAAEQYRQRAEQVFGRRRRLD